MNNKNIAKESGKLLKIALKSTKIILLMPNNLYCTENKINWIGLKN